MADTAQQAEARRKLRERADQVSSRVPAPGEETTAETALDPPRTEARAEESEGSERRTETRSSGGPQQPGRPKGSSGRSASRGPASRPLLPRQRGSHGSAPEYRNYQSIILVEFVLAELLVAMTPIATRQNQPGLSPYIPRDMTKLLAIGLFYFLAELAATTGRTAGRAGAWLGLLVLLTVGVNEAANVAKILNIFGESDKTKSTDHGHLTVPGVNAA